MSRKLVIDDGRAERELLLVGTMVVGRDPACEISSGDPRLSRKHAEFRVTSSGVIVRDLQSRNGVRVNGTVVQEVALAPGDVVQVAHLSLRFVDEAEAVTAVPHASPVTPVTVAAPVEDDRTRAVPASAVAQPPTAPTMPMGAFVPPGLGDDRTRVLAGRGPASGAARAAASAPTAPITVGPADVGEIVIREPAATSRTVATAASEDLGVQALASLGWGRRVLMQGLLLALLVFVVTAIPIVAWQSRAFGVSALDVWTVLLPPLGASAFAGVMVAGLIARTVVRGRERDVRR